MMIEMDLKEPARINLKDLMHVGSVLISLTVFAITIHNGLGYLKETVAEIRLTQIENTKKNDLRWETIGVEINALKLNQSLMEQRIRALEEKK